MFYDIVVKNKALSDKDGHHPHERHRRPTKRHLLTAKAFAATRSKPALEEGED
jgi:hypothetical protein